LISLIDFRGVYALSGAHKRSEERNIHTGPPSTTKNMAETH
jgi:hypothetical protein